MNEEKDQHVTANDMIQEDYFLSQLPPNRRKNNFKDQNLMGTELKHKPPMLSSKQVCSHGNHDQFGITKFATVSVCLICKTVIYFSESDPCNKNHLGSTEHRVNQSRLFEQCFYNPGLNSKHKIYCYILNNSLIDFSTATEISSDEENVVCFVCKHEFSSSKSSKDVLVDNFLHHLKDNNHFRNVQDNFSWTCQMPSGGHMTLYKTLFYCSACEESIACDDCCLMQTAVNHLETKHRNDCISNGWEEETVCLKEKTSMSTSSNDESDCDQMDSEEFYSLCDDENAVFEDDTRKIVATEVNLAQIHEEKTEIKKHDDDGSYMCIECGGDIEMVLDDFELSFQLHLLSHEVVTKQNCAELVEKVMETLDNQDSTKNSSKEFAEAEKRYLELSLKELSICNSDKKIPQGLKNRNQKQTKIKQKSSNKKKIDTKDKFFSDLSDCLPANFHKDLIFVAIKSNQFHCELCICSLGVVSNVFDSSLTLYNHFSSNYHANQMYLAAERKSVNKPKTKQNLPNNKTKEKSFDISPVVTENKLTGNKVSKTNHVPLVNLPENDLCSNNTTAKLTAKTDLNDKLILNTQKQTEEVGDKNTKVNKHSKLPISETLSTTSLRDQKLCDLHSTSNLVTSQIQRQIDMSSNTTNKDKKLPEVQDISNKSPPVTKQTEVVGPMTKLINSSKTDSTKLKPSITNLLNDSNGRAHQQFFEHKQNNIHCCLCSCDVSENQEDIKKHINGIEHRVKFLSELKRSLKESQRNQVKFLLFVNGQLFCSICRCYATPWNSFVEICHGVETHFENDAHSTSDREKKVDSGKADEEIGSRNEKTSMVEDKTASNPLSLEQQSECKLVKAVSPPIIRNALLNGLGQKSCEALVDKPSKLLKSVEDITAGASSSDPVVASSHKLDVKLESVKKRNEDLPKKNVQSASSVDRSLFVSSKSKIPADLKNKSSCSTSTDERIKMDLSLKRLITTTPLVRVNKDYIEQKSKHFNCILCSVCIPYAPQKFVLAKNFNLHFKSAGHIFLANKISKVKNVPKTSKVLKTEVKEPHKSRIPNELHEVEIAPSSPPQNLNDKDSKPISTSSEKKRLKSIKTEKVKVCTKRTSALKKFVKKYKRESGLDLFEINPSRSISNKSMSQKMHPLLQKLLPAVPLLPANKQYIIRSSINFYCTLCCKDILFSTNDHVLAKSLNYHFKSATHVSLLNTKQSDGSDGKRDTVKNSTDSSSEHVPSQARKAEGGCCNVLNEGKIEFKEIYDTLVELRNEVAFFCNYCVKLKKTVPHKSFEYSVIEHSLKSHKIKGPKYRNDGVIADVVWINNILKANLKYVEMSQEAAACGICCRPVAFSKNYNILIFNFLLHFQDEKHKLVIRSTKTLDSLSSERTKSKRYRPNFKAYEGTNFV